VRAESLPPRGPTAPPAGTVSGATVTGDGAATATSAISGSSRWLALGLTVIAAALIEGVALHLETFGDAAAFVGGTAAVAALLVAVAHLTHHFRHRVATTARGRLIWSIVGMALATLLEMVVREAAGQPLPPERVLLVMLRNLALVLALLAHHADTQGMACALATFLVVFASALAAQPWAPWLVILFAIGGIWWLMGTYWETLEGRLAAESARTLPRRWLILLPAVILALLAAVPAARRQITTLDGFMPTSGGQRRGGDNALDGVGSGDQLVAGLDDIRSFAPLDDAPFMASHEPTLYDMFDESYNEAVRQKNQERAVTLFEQQRLRRENPSAATSRRAGREFSLVRKPGRSPARRADDLDSPAVFHLMGRVPLHLKLESFALYDGVEWFPEPAADTPPTLEIEDVAGRPWLRLGLIAGFRIHAPPETHAVRVVHIDTPRIPSPNQLVGIHIADMRQADFYRWAQPGIVALDRQRLPELLSLWVQSRVVDPRLLRGVPVTAFAHGPLSYRQFGTDPGSLAVRALAESWVAGLPRGWPQIERVVEQIRTLHVLDREARASPDTDHAVAEFLLDTRRGPDYLFAAATVWALRSLGYAARLAGGFYADPARYDRRSGHTSVLAADAHMWAEVSCGHHDWVTLEPTPGYTVLGPPPTLGERLVAPLVTAARFLTRHPWAVVAAVLAAAATVILWPRLLDAGDRLVWLAFCREPAAATRGLVALLDRRCRRAGVPRPRSVTPPRWLVELATRDTPPGMPTVRADEPSIRGFRRLADAALYDPHWPAAGDGASVRATCLAAERLWNYDRLRSLARQQPRDRRHRASARRASASSPAPHPRITP
jgi:hypothetical protein